jgi:hypothetical protein
LARFCLLTFRFLVALSIDDHDFAEPSTLPQRRSYGVGNAAHFRSRHTTAVGLCVLRLPALVGPEPDPAVRAVTKRLALGTAATA